MFVGNALCKAWKSINVKITLFAPFEDRFAVVPTRIHEFV
jgi:hypothetical protein